MWRLIFTTLITFSSSSKIPTTRSPRIVGGEVISYDKAPYQVAILDSQGSQWCGGSALSKQFVLTAAHCTYKNKAKSLSVLVGTDTIGNGGTKIKILKITVHPEYDPSTLDYDYSILKLSKIKNYPLNVVFVALPNENEEEESGERVFVSGWGDTRTDEDKSLLRGAEVPIVDRETCSNNHGTTITARMICAGFSEGGTSSCYGDSGGPLVRVSDTVLVGVVSWGPQTCAEPNKPGVYAKVSYVLKWIKKIAKV